MTRHMTDSTLEAVTCLLGAYVAAGRSWRRRCTKMGLAAGATYLHEPERIFSIDVECVAVGTTHERSSRAPCEVALVDCYGTVLLQTYILPSKPVISFLTPFTGLRKGDLARKAAVPLPVAVRRLKKRLPSNAVLVGQNILSDIAWMELKHGIDYDSHVDLATIYQEIDGRVWPLQHLAEVLLHKRRVSRSHNPVWDARVSVELYYTAASASEHEFAGMRKKLMTYRGLPQPSLAKQCGYKLDGVCLSGASRQRCSCGKPVMNTWLT